MNTEITFAKNCKRICCERTAHASGDRRSVTPWGTRGLRNVSIIYMSKLQTCPKYWTIFNCYQSSSVSWLIWTFPTVLAWRIRYLELIFLLFSLCCLHSFRHVVIRILFGAVYSKWLDCCYIWMPIFLWRFIICLVIFLCCRWPSSVSPVNRRTDLVDINVIYPFADSGNING